MKKKKKKKKNTTISFKDGLMLDELNNKTIETPSKWLDNYLKSRSLNNTISSRPLYSYQTSLAEYKTLKVVVIFYNPKISSHLTHRSWDACFVLFCSEWYRRLYQADDGWSWQGIWDELGFKKDASERETIIKQGLERFWRRPILRFTQSRNFLGSVFSEGGLPFKLISKSDNKFGYLMHRTLKDFYQIDLFRITLQDIIRRNVDSLPDAFHQEGSIELIADIVNQLMKLVKFHQLDRLESEKPSTYLDKVSSDWRSHFPIPLDTETGTDLLDNWLLKATQASGTIKNYKTSLSCTHYLTLPNLNFRTEVILPNTLEFDFDQSDINNTRIDIDIYEGEKAIAYLGGSFAEFDDGFTQLRPKQKGVKIKRAKLNTTLGLIASDAGKFLERKEIEHSAIQLGEVPLGFDEKNGLFQLIGQASFSTKKETVYLLLPKDFDVEVIIGNCELENTFHDYCWYKVKGDLRCISDAGVYRISTNKSVNTNGMISLYGNEVLWGTTPSIVYKGAPNFKVNTDTPVSKYDFKSFLNNREVHSLLNNQKYGKHTFTVKNLDNDILLKRNVGILPKDFDVSFKPGVKAGEGKVIVTSSENAVYSLTGEGVEVTSNRILKGIEFSLSAENLPPANVSLSVLANLLSEPIKIDLPYPASGILAFDKENRKLAGDVSVEDLLGSRLHLYRSKISSEVFEIELALLPHGRNTPSYHWNVRVDDKPVEINLYSYKERINELMSLGSLDAIVRLKIRGKGRNVKTFNIRRHSHKIEIDREMHTVSLKGSASLKYMLDDGFKPIAMLIGEPERNSFILEPKKVAGLHVGFFEIPSVMDKEGPWLIVPHEDSEISFRPGFYDQHEREVLDEITSIKLAVEQLGLKGKGRNTISKFIKEIENKPQDHNWNYFIKLWEKYSHLPLSTFEAWRDLVKNHKALALLLLKMEMDERLILRISHEFTIIGEMISPYVWIEAKNTFSEYLQSAGLPEEMCTTVVNGLFDKMRDALPNYPQEVIDFFKTEKMPPLIPGLVMQEVVFSGWVQDLIRNNCDAIWPCHFEKIFIKWLDKNSELKCYFKIPNDYQYSVALLPVICASIAAGNTRISDLFEFDNETLFDIKLIRSFDHNWFNPVYSYFLNLFLFEKQ